MGGSGGGDQNGREGLGQRGRHVWRREEEENRQRRGGQRTAVSAGALRDGAGHGRVPRVMQHAVTVMVI